MNAAGANAAEVDFEAEGLLDGLDDEAERDARLDLLQQLAASGVPLDELKRAVAEERLALLPVERVLSTEPKYTLGEVAERAGIDRDFLFKQLRALGAPCPDDGEAAFGDADLEAARATQQFRAAGVPDEAQLEIARVLGQGLARAAEAMRTAVGETFLRPGDTERDLGLRYAEVAQRLGPLTTPLLGYVLNVHLRELVRSDVVRRAEMASGRLPGSVEVAVCFADLVGFTRLGELVPADELGGIAGRLVRIASELAESPVRLVKTIGDAVMLVSTDVDRLIETALELVDRAGAEGENGELPQLHAGIACGSALNRGGDWYGRPVNLASRVTDMARPGSVLVTSDVRKQAEGEYRWSRAGRRRIKGVADPVPLYRVRRAEEPVPADRRADARSEPGSDDGASGAG